MATPEPTTRDQITDSLKSLPKLPKPPSASVRAEMVGALGLPKWTPGSGLPTPQQQLGRTRVTPVSWRQTSAREAAYMASLSPLERQLAGFSEGPIMKSLMGLTKPLSFMVGGLKESIDFVSSGFDTNEFDTNDWRKAVDETYFFGDLLHDFDILQGDNWWEKWGARVGGFIGDVALDPLTYLGFVGKGVSIAASLARVGGRSVAGKAVRNSVIRGLGDDGVRSVRALGLVDGLTDDVLEGAVDDIMRGTDNFVTHLDDGGIAFSIGKNSKKVGEILAEEAGVVTRGVAAPTKRQIDDIGRVILDADTVRDVKTIMNAELRAGIKGASAVTTNEIRVTAKHMFESGMDRAGRIGPDALKDVADAGYREGFLKNMKEVSRLDLNFGLKIPGTGPIGRVLFRHNMQRPLGLRLMSSSAPGIGTFVRGVPQSARFMSFGLKHGESGLFGWMKRGGRLPDLRKMMRTEWLDDPVMRHAGRRALHAAGRGDAMARTVKQELGRHAGEFFKEVKASRADPKDVYHALAGDEAAAARIGQDLTDKGIKFMATLREVANTRAGYEFLGEASNYVPRVLSDDARDYLDKKGIGLVTRRHRRPYTQSGFEKQRKYVSREDFDALVEAEYTKIKKKNVKATMAKALRNVEARGVQADFLGDELLSPGTALGDGVVAKDIEQQIADIMERLGISYALFDDDLAVSIPAYIEAVSKRSGEVYTETLLRDKGIFLDRMVEFLRFPDARVSAMTNRVRKAQMVVSKSAAGLQRTMTKASEASGDQLTLLNRQIAEQEAVLKDAEAAYLRHVDRYNSVMDAKLDDEAALLELQKRVDKAINDRDLLTVMQTGINLQEQVAFFEASQTIQNELYDLLGNGRVIRANWGEATAATAAAIHLDDKIISVFGDSEVFEAVNHLLGRAKVEAEGGFGGARFLDQFTGPERTTSTVHTVDKGTEMARQVRIEVYEEPGFGGVGTAEQDEFIPEAFLKITKSDGTELVLSNRQVEEMMGEARGLVDELDTQGVGSWLGVEMQLEFAGMEGPLKAMENNPVGQLTYARDTMKRRAREAAERVNRYLEASNLTPDDIAERVGLGAVPTPEAVVAAKGKILSTFREAAAMPPAEWDRRGTLTSWLLGTDDEFQEAIWTYYNVMPPGGVKPGGFVSSSQLDSVIDQMQVQAKQMLASLEAQMEPSSSLLFYVRDEDGHVIRELGLPQYVAAKRYQLGMEEAQYGPQAGGFSVHRTDANDILNETEYLVLASGGGNAGNAPAHPDGEFAGGMNWQTAAHGADDHAPAAPVGGSNPGFLVKVPKSAANPIKGPGDYYYVKMYENATMLDVGVPFDTHGAVLFAEHSGKHRVQGEALANALYVSFGQERGMGRFGGVTGHAPISGAARLEGAPLGAQMRDAWTLTSGYARVVTAINDLPIAEQVRVRMPNGFYDVAHRQADGTLLDRNRQLIGFERDFETVPLSELAGEQFIVDVLTANWDAFGLHGDNIGILPETGEVFRLDNGGTFHFGAMGDVKDKPNAPYNWRGVHEIVPGPGTTKGTYLGGLDELGVLTTNVGGKPAKVGQYQVPAWQQFEMAMDAYPQGAGFTGEMEQQIQTLLRVRAQYGGWEPYVRNVLGNAADDADIRLFTEWLDVRTKVLADKFGLEMPMGSQQMIIDSVPQNIGDVALSQVLKELPYSPLQAAAKLAGEPSWLSGNFDSLIGSFTTGTDPRSQAVKLVDIARAVRMAKGADDKAILRVLRDLDLPDLVENGEYLNPADPHTQKLLFDDTAQELFDEDLLATEHAIEDATLADEVAELAEPTAEDMMAEEAWLADEAVLDEAFPGAEYVDYDIPFDVDNPAAMERWLNEMAEQAAGEPPLTGFVSPKVGAKINEALAQATTMAQAAIRRGPIKGLGDVPFTAAQRARGQVAVAIVDKEGKVIMRMPVSRTTGGRVGKVIGSNEWTHTVVDLEHYAGQTHAQAAVAGVKDSTGLDIEIIGFASTSDDLPVMVARVPWNKPSVTAAGPENFSGAPEARGQLLNLIHRTSDSGMLDPNLYVGKAQPQWIDTSVGMNAVLPPIWYEPPYGFNNTYNMQIRLPQGAVRNLKMYGIAPHMHKTFAEGVMEQSGLQFSQSNLPAITRAQGKIEDAASASIVNGMTYVPGPSSNYGMVDMRFDLLARIHDGEGTLWDELLTFMRHTMDRSNFWNIPGSVGQGFDKRPIGRMFAELIDAVETLGGRGVQEFDELSFRDRLTFLGYLSSDGTQVVGPSDFRYNWEGAGVARQFEPEGVKRYRKVLEAFARMSDGDLRANVLNFKQAIDPQNVGTDYFRNRIRAETAPLLHPISSSDADTGIWSAFSARTQEVGGNQGLSAQRGHLSGSDMEGKGLIRAPHEVKTKYTEDLIAGGPGRTADVERVGRLYGRTVEAFRRSLSADGYTAAVWANPEGGAQAGAKGVEAETIGQSFANFMITNPRAATFDLTPIQGGLAVPPGTPSWEVTKHGAKGAIIDNDELITQYERLFANQFGEGNSPRLDYEDTIQLVNEDIARAVESSQVVADRLRGAQRTVDDAHEAMMTAEIAEEFEGRKLDELMAVNTAVGAKIDRFSQAQQSLDRLGAGRDANGNEIPLDDLSDDLRNLRIAVDLLGEADAEAIRMTADAIREGAGATKALSSLEPVGEDSVFFPLTRWQDHEEILENVWVAGFRPFGTHTQGPADMVEAMTAVTRFRAQGGWGSFLRQYDKIHNLMKGYMIMKPGFHMRNYFSGVFMNYLHGVRLSSYRQFQRAYWRFQYDEAVAAGLERRAARMKKTMVSRGIWGKADAEDMALIRTMRDGGILGGTQGQVAGEFLAAPEVAGKRINFGLINPLNPRNAPLRISREVGVGTETFLRGVMGFDTLKKGGTVDEAFDTIVKFHFDYDDLSDFERKVVKRLVPFYTWTKKAMPLMLEQIGRNPAKMTAYLKLKHEMEQDAVAPAVIPEYFKRQGAIQLPWKYKGENMFILPDLPFKTPLELIDPALAFKADLSPVERLRIASGSLGTQITPLVKAPYEWNAKQNLWKGYTFDGRFQQVPTVFHKIPLLMNTLKPLGLAHKENDIWLMRDYNLHTMAQLLPTFSDMRRLFPSEERYQQRTLSTWMSFMFGIGLRTNTVDEQQRTLRAEYFKQLEELRDMRNLMAAVDRPA